MNSTAYRYPQRGVAERPIFFIGQGSIALLFHLVLAALGADLDLGWRVVVPASSHLRALDVHDLRRLRHRFNLDPFGALLLDRELRQVVDDCLGEPEVIALCPERD